jgi:hypothetical protein
MDAYWLWRFRLSLHGRNLRILWHMLREVQHLAETTSRQLDGPVPPERATAKVSDTPILVTVRIAISQVARCWRRGGEGSILVIIPESSPSD